jgi:hypothetical protein
MKLEAVSNETAFEYLTQNEHAGMIMQRHLGTAWDEEK